MAPFRKPQGSKYVIIIYSPTSEYLTIGSLGPLGKTSIKVWYSAAQFPTSRARQLLSDSFPKGSGCCSDIPLRRFRVRVSGGPGFRV